MQDQNFHEIQLSGKQLLFGFISAVVLLVVIFLLGVSVGRGVRTSPIAADTAAQSAVPGATGGTDVATSSPAQPNDLNYPVVLKGQPAGGSPDPQTAATPPPVDPKATAPVDPPKPAVEPPKPPAESAKPSQEQAKGSAPPPAPDKKPVPPAAGWYAQLGAYGTKRSAEAVSKNAASKGFNATVTPYGQFFRVRVGPFATQAEAEREKARLAKAGIQSSVIR